VVAIAKCGFLNNGILYLLQAVKTHYYSFFTFVRASNSCLKMIVTKKGFLIHSELGGKVGSLCLKIDIVYGSKKLDTEPHQRQLLEQAVDLIPKLVDSFQANRDNEQLLIHFVHQALDETWSWVWQLYNKHIISEADLFSFHLDIKNIKQELDQLPALRPH
jgi:hypothetical protein